MKDVEKIALVVPNRDRAEIYAYLEAHQNKANRVNIVIDEFLRTPQDHDACEEEEDRPCPLPPPPAVEKSIDVPTPKPLSALERDVEQICTVFIGVDPNYVHERLIELGNIKERVELLSAMMLEKNDYPRLKDRLEKENKEKRNSKIRSMEFNMEEFLTLYQDPLKTFYDESKKVG